MDKYIDREAFLAREQGIYCDDCGHRKNSKGKIVYAIGDAPCRACGICDVLDDVDDFPAADVRPVVHGRWERYTESERTEPYYRVRCSCCKWDGPEWVKYYYYCPNCGCDMEG